MNVADTLPQFRFLDSVEEHLESEWSDSPQSIEDVRVLVRRSLEHFPKLHDRTITVGVTHPESTWHGEPHAMADPHNNVIYLNSDSATEYQTIFHELTHILIRVENDNGAEHPQTSEEYCSIYAVSKMPPDLVFREDIAYLGTPGVSKEQYPAICQSALEYRENNRNYIQKAKEWLEIND